MCLGKNPFGSATLIVKTSPLPNAYCAAEPSTIIALITEFTVNCHDLGTEAPNFTLYAEDKRLSYLRKLINNNL